MTNVPEDHCSEEIRDVIQVNGDAVRGHLDELVRSTVEETLNQIRCKDGPIVRSEALPAVARSC
ncbi:hypothetical protein DTL42_01365 [Bremerella cremea]|uniref:Uncharacterized protein n=1 Tax=Bremerella cremea TaxID=1031537 RepID=A0A368KXE2_9BACT|nr:hypothetical protein [Bremerella cremea]RCS55780.1 hypothetical protein DTL42_01365 [Bremerella cremea]